MKKHWYIGLIVIVLVMLMAMPAFALEEFKFDKSKLFVEAEYGMGEKDIENVNLLSIGVGSFFGGSLAIVTDDVQLNTELINLGYKVSEYAIPYAVLGYSQLGFDQVLQGDIAIGSFSGGTPLLGTEYRESSLTYGVGLKGDLIKVEGVTLGYNLRYIRTSGEERDESIVLLPDLIGIGTSNAIDVAYQEVDIATILSKEIDLRDEEGNAQVVEKITPFIGYQYSLVTLDVDNKVEIGCVSIANEMNYQGGEHNGLFGANVQINDQLDVKVAGVAGKNFGGSVALAYKF